MKKKMEDIISYFKKNKIYILSYIFFFAILYLLMNQVVMYADDFILKMDSERTFTQIIDYMVHHYLNWGGGLTPLYVIIVFKLGFGAWKILNTFLITTMFFLFTKLISKNEKKFIKNFSIIWILFYIINIAIVRESIYWLDGSMAYVISTFQIFMFVYMLYTRFIKNESKKYDVVLLPIVALFSGWSGAQTSAMTLIITILFIIYYIFIKHNKVNWKFLIFAILGIAGSVIFLASPGNGARMDTFQEFANLNIINKVSYRVSDVTKTTYMFEPELFTTVPIYVYIFSYLLLVYNFVFYKKYNNKNKKILGIFILIQSVFLFVTLLSKYTNLEFINNFLFNYENLYQLNFTDVYQLVKIIPYAFVFIFIASNFFTLLFRKLDDFNILLILILISSYCSQYSMVLAPYMPYRTCITAIIFLIFGIALLMDKLDEQKVNYEIIYPIIIAYVNIQVSILIILFGILINNIGDKNLKKIFYFICVFPFIAIALNNYKDLLYCYNANKQVFNENVKILEKSKEEENVIYLKKTPFPEYEFTPLAGYDWIENDVKLYYGIKKTTDLDYEIDDID